MIEIYGTERVMVNSAGDWGHSDPLAVPEFIFEMRRRGHDDALIRKVVYENPLTFFSQSARFDFVAERDGRNGRRRLNRIRIIASMSDAMSGRDVGQRDGFRCR